MLQNTSKTIGFQKIMVYKTPPGGGGKPYLARGLNIFNIYFCLKESNYIVICKIWLFKLFFLQYYKSDMSKYGYLELFLRVLSISR